MTTLLYGDKPGADVEPGNRVDTESGGAAASPPPMRSMWETPPTDHHLQARPFALRGLVLGLAAAAAVLAGVTIAAIALVWSRSITPGAQVALIVIGIALMAGGTAYAVSASPGHTTR